MANLVEFVAGYPVDGRTLLSDLGTFWAKYFDEPAAIAAIQETLAWNEFQQFDELSKLRQRHTLTGGSDVIYRLRQRFRIDMSAGTPGRPSWFELPRSVLHVHEISLFDGTRLEYGRDFVLSGNRVLCNRNLVSGEQSIVCRNLEILTGDMSRFWSAVCNIASDSDNDSELIRAFVAAHSGMASEVSFRDLLAVVFDCQVPKQTCVVEHIVTGFDRAIIVTDVDVFVGAVGSSALVSVGDTIYPYDDIFDTLQYWDCTKNAPPVWLSSLKVPARYWAPYVAGQLEFTNTEQVLTSNVDADGKLRVRFPITGADADVDKFWEFVDRREDELGYGLASLIVSRPRPTQSQLPATVNPLRIVWQSWLNFGATVSLVRSEVTLKQLRLLQLLRRACPPWQTHLTMFDQPVPAAFDFYC